MKDKATPAGTAGLGKSQYAIERMAKMKCLGMHYAICATCSRTGNYTAADYSRLRTQFIITAAIQHSDGTEECHNYTAATPNK